MTWSKVEDEDGLLPCRRLKRALQESAAEEAVENMRGKAIARNPRQPIPSDRPTSSNSTDTLNPTDKSDEDHGDTREDCMFVKEMTREERDQIGWQNAIIIE